MPGRMIGLEIGNDSIKLAVCSGGRVLQLATKRVHIGSVIDGKIVSRDDMVSVIREALKENGIHGSACALVLPRQAVIGRSVTVPAMGYNEMMLNLPFEFKDFIGRDGEKYYYDYVVKKITGASMEIYACAVLKTDIEFYRSMLRAAGLSLKVAIPKEMAWLNLIRRADSEPKNLCIIDVGQNITSVNIFADNGYAMGKDIELAGGAVDQALGKYFDLDPFAGRTRKEANLDNCLGIDPCVGIFSDIATEVTRILKFYNDTHSNAVVNDIYYCGGSSMMEALRIAIVKSTEMVPHHISRLVPGDFEKEELLLRSAIAAGAAMQS